MIKEEDKRGDSSYAEGCVSVLSILENHSREVKRILFLPTVKKSERSVLRVLKLAKDASVPLEMSDNDFFEKVTTGHTHGGIIAEVGDRELTSAEAIFAHDKGFVFMLCGIEDPFNFGCAIRSFFAAGATGMVLSPRNWLSAAGVTIRASAGATERLPCAICDDNEELCRLAKARGYRIVCATEENSESLFSADLIKPVFLIVGGEKRGISKELLKAADLRVRIPYGASFRASLTASAASAVCAFEIFRQNREEN